MSQVRLPKFFGYDIQTFLNFSNEIFIFDDANCHLSKFISKQNIYFGSDINHRKDREKPLHNLKIIVLCFVGSIKITESHFFEDVNYINHIVRQSLKSVRTCFLDD